MSTLIPKKSSWKDFLARAQNASHTMKHMRAEALDPLPVSRMCSLANPESSSKAARDTFRSVFHEDIRRWQTK